MNKKMKMVPSWVKSGLCVLATGMIAAPTFASLESFQTFNGSYAVSTDGFGSNNNGGSGFLTANVPSGSNVVAAYLYSAYIYNRTPADATALPVTFSGNSLSWTHRGTNNQLLSSYRADVTSIVQSAVGGGGGAFNFAVAEGSDNLGIDGEALVVVYQNASIGPSTVAILDGFSQTTGDQFSVNFADPLDTSDPGFHAEMRLGISFSCCNQQSTVSVNGTDISTVAGNNDDGDAIANGALLTMGGDDDAFTPDSPVYGEDHERYDLTAGGLVADGDTSILVETLNPSNDDNIFLAVFNTSGFAAVNEEPPTSDVPEPGSLALFGLGLVGLGLSRRRSKK